MKAWLAALYEKTMRDLNLTAAPPPVLIDPELTKSIMLGSRANCGSVETVSTDADMRTFCKPSWVGFDLDVDGLERSFLRMASGSSIPAAPRWAETTLQWVRENYPMYAPAWSSKTAEERLHASLRTMSYLKAEHDHAGASMKDYSALLDELVAGWNKDEHDKLRAFLTDGGYDTVKAQYDALDQSNEALEAEVAAETVAALNEADAAYTAALDDQAELRELISSEIREQDPLAGQW